MPQQRRHPLRLGLLLPALVAVLLAVPALELVLERPVVIATADPAAGLRPAVDPPPSSLSVQCPPPLEEVSETYRSLQQLAELEAESRWQRRIAALEKEVDRERARLDNERRLWARERSAGRPASPPPSRRESPRRPARLEAATPRVRLVGSDALVTGELRNRGDRQTRASFLVELLLDGKVYDRARLRLTVPARGSVPWSKTFHTSLATGTYSARVELRGGG